MDTTKTTILEFIYKLNAFGNKIMKTIDGFERPIVPDKFQSIKETLESFSGEAANTDLALILSEKEIEIYDHSTESMTVKMYAWKLIMIATRLTNVEELEKWLELAREYYSNMTSLAFNFLKKIHPTILTGELVDYTTAPKSESDHPLGSKSVSQYKLVNLLIHVNGGSSDMLKVIDEIKQPNSREYLSTILNLCKIEKSTSLQEITKWISYNKYTLFERQLSSLFDAHGLDSGSISVMTTPDLTISYGKLADCQRSIEEARTYYQIFPMFLFTFLKRQYPNTITGKFTDYC